MFDTKIIIIICVAGCLLIFYYLYNEISNVKKIMEPTYQKTMLLENKVAELEKKTLNSPKRKRRSTQSPVFSMTYNSADVVKDELSVKYRDLSEAEAQRIINQNKELNQLYDGLNVSVPISSDVKKHVSENAKYLDMPSDNCLSGFMQSDNKLSPDKSNPLLNLPTSCGVTTNRLGSNILNKINIDPKRKSIKSY